MAPMSATDNLKPEDRRRAMRAVRRRDTSDELRLRKALWRSGVRGWRCDYRSLPGRPDIAFPARHVAVFVDGGFWHGHASRFPRPGLTRYWLEKIERNIARDRTVDSELEAMGWKVVRIWDFEAKRDLAGSVLRVTEALRQGGG